MSDELEFFSSGVKFEWENTQIPAVADSVYYSLIFLIQSRTREIKKIISAN